MSVRHEAAFAQGRLVTAVVLRGVRVTILGSGSEGNATLFDSGPTRLLVDAGLSLKRTRERALAALGAPLERLDAVVITHAHGDHVAHARRIARAYDAPIYAQVATAQQCNLGDVRPYAPSGRFQIGALSVSTRPIPHDTPQVAVVLSDRDDCVGLVTDLGHVPGHLTAHLRRCRTLLIESNHDPELLAIAPYPVFVRARIAGSHGHLANAQTAKLLKRLAKAPLERVVLMHLSQKANSPEKAHRIARHALRNHEVELLVASQKHPMVLEEKGVRQLSLAFG